MATTTHGNLQESGNGVTRRDVIRWVGRVAVASTVTTLGASGLGDSVDASRRGKRHRKQRRQDELQAISSRAIDATFLPEDQIDGDLAFAGNRCRYRLVCTPSCRCTHRSVCW